LVVINLCLPRTMHLSIICVVKLLFIFSRYRMSRDLFLRIMDVVESHGDYFVQKRNAANVLGLSCFQKVTAAFRMLIWGSC
jgi:hypothetical protein